MYQAEASSALLANGRKLVTSQRSWMAVGRTVFLLGVTSLLTDISAEMVSTTLPVYLLVTLGFSPVQLGLVDGIYQGAAALVNVISGFAADRWKRPKEVAAVGYGCSALCKAGLLLVGGSWTGISGLIALDRAGKGVRTAPRDAMIAATTEPELRGTAFGVHRALDTAGAMLGPLLAVAILTFAPDAYDAIFVVSLCIAVVGLFVIVLFVDNPPAETTDASASERPRVSGREAAALIRHADFRNVVVLGTVLAVATISDNLLYLALRQRVSVPAAWFPLFYVMTAMIFMAAAIPIGRVADRIGRRRVFVLGYGVLFVGYGILLAPHTSHVGVASVLVCLGLFYASTDGVLPALASETLPPHLRTTGLALLTTGTGFGRLVASAVFGMLWSAFGAELALAVFASALMATLMAVGVTLNRIGPRS